MRPSLARPALLLLLASALAAPAASQGDLIETVILPPGHPYRFGQGVALDDETLVISSREELGFPTYDELFRVAILSRADWSATVLRGDELGGAVAVEGELVAIAGVEIVQVFRRVLGGWERVAALPYYRVKSVSLNGGRLAVGGAFEQGGSFVEILRRTSVDGSHWESEALLEGPANFASNVTLWGDTLAVGRLGNFVNVFRRVEDAIGGSTWIEAAVLDGGTAANDKLFGIALDLREDLLLVGAPYEKAGDSTGLGAAFVYRRLGGERGPWVLEAVLKARPGNPRDGYGHSVAIGEDELYVGAYLDEVRTANEAGSVHRYARGGPGQPPWKTVERLFASDFHELAHFGIGLAAHGRDLLVGAPSEGFEFIGEAYLYQPARTAKPR